MLTLNINECLDRINDALDHAHAAMRYDNDHYQEICDALNPLKEQFVKLNTEFNTIPKPYTIIGFLGGVFVFHTKMELRSWIDGAKQALYAFAYSKDGVLYVGTTGRTYKTVLDDLFEQYQEVTGVSYEDDNF